MGYFDIPHYQYQLDNTEVARNSAVIVYAAYLNKLPHGLDKYNPDKWSEDYRSALREIENRTVEKSERVSKYTYRTFPKSVYQKILEKSNCSSTLPGTTVAIILSDILSIPYIDFVQSFKERGDEVPLRIVLEIPDDKLHDIWYLDMLIECFRVFGYFLIGDVERRHLCGCIKYTLQFEPYEYDDSQREYLDDGYECEDINPNLYYIPKY